MADDKNDGGIQDFDGDSLRTQLIGLAGNELTAISTSTTCSIKDQMDIIRESIQDFNYISKAIEVVNTDASDIHKNMNEGP